MNVHIHSLHIYPIKSCQGINLQTAELTHTGFKFDRHWMLIDKQGHFLSQRSHPQLAKIKTSFTDDTLIAESENSRLEIPLYSKDNDRLQVRIWNDECSAARVSKTCNEWFSQILNTECELVFLPETEKRRVDENFARQNETVGFADGFPLLILSRASIDLLNSQLQNKVDINRFRANIVLDGCDAHAEDDWSKIIVNNIEIKLPKACSRCIIPSIDQATAEKYPEVLKVLSQYRKHQNHIYFGQNAIHLSPGHIATGQSVIYQTRASS